MLYMLGGVVFDVYPTNVDADVGQLQPREFSLRGSIIRWLTD